MQFVKVFTTLNLGKHLQRLAMTERGIIETGSKSQRTSQEKKKKKTNNNLRLSNL